MKLLELKDLIDAGVHFGHQTQKWNPRMKPFVYKEKGGIHIINLKKSVGLLKEALDKVRDTAFKGGRLIFVGTKKQAVEPVQRAAKKCNQFYITKRWLGGTLTNFVTIKSSIDRFKKIDQMRDKGELDYLSKKEKAKVEKEYGKLKEYLEGIREMKDSPALMFVVDLVKEHIAVAESRKLKIPVIGIADTNSNPNGIDFPIPGNDDSIRSIDLFSDQVAEAFLEGEAQRQESLLSEEEKEALGHDIQKDVASRVEESAVEIKKESQNPVSGHRKLVAAGMAENVEIEMELEKESSPKTENIEGKVEGKQKQPAEKREKKT